MRQFPRLPCPTHGQPFLHARNAAAWDIFWQCHSLADSWAAILTLLSVYAQEHGLAWDDRIELGRKSRILWQLWQQRNGS